MNSKYEKACNTLLYVCGCCKKDEEILIITDPTSSEIARVLWDAARDLSNKNMIMMDDRSMHGEEPTKLVADAMMACDVMFRVTKYSLSSTKARKRAIEAGKRDVNMADYRLSMLESGGLFTDFIEAGKVVKRVAKSIEGEKIKIVSPGGTNFTASIKGNPGREVSGRSTKPGELASPPDIEANIGAIEGTANGIIRVDGSIPYPSLGLISDEIWLTVEKSVITDIKGGPQAAELARLLASYNDPRVYRIGEIGIGLNPDCRLCGLMLEDEGVYGTVHFGIGNNLAWGGTSDCSLHLDAIILKPTLTVDDRIIIENGELRV
ncbi:MAG: hypothetical protein M0P77_03705 [Firmicutes bacterium]|nr:hypothetical protein [Bacillota bacterium]